MPSPGRAGDEDAAGAATPDADQVRGGEQPQAFPQRRAADAELRRELLLGADPVARAQALALQVAAQLERDLVARVGARGGEARLRELGRGHRRSNRVRHQTGAHELERHVELVHRGRTAARRAGVDGEQDRDRALPTIWLQRVRLDVEIVGEPVRDEPDHREHAAALEAQRSGSERSRSRAGGRSPSRRRPGRHQAARGPCCCSSSLSSHSRITSWTGMPSGRCASRAAKRSIAAS